jgi:hypothetical protein
VGTVTAGTKFDTAEFRFCDQSFELFAKELEYIGKEFKVNATA